MSGDCSYNEGNIRCYVMEGGRVIPGVNIPASVLLLFGFRKKY